MKTVKVLTILVFAFALVVCFSEVSEAVPIGTAWTYQGRLMDGSNPADGLYDFQFRLFDDPCTGTQQGITIDVNELDVIDGYFTVELDFGADVFDGDARWLEISVRLDDGASDFITLIPRKEVTTIPYALYALNGPGSTGFWAANGNNIYNTNSGSVGIGTSSPIWELDVANLTAGDGAEIGVRANDAGGAFAAYSSTLPAPFGHYAGRVSLFAGLETPGLDLRADGVASDMRFYTGGPWPFNERMRLTKDGYLGIGTTSPELKLSVEAGGISINSLLDDGAGWWNNGLVFTNKCNGMGPWTHAAIWADGVSNFNGELVFGVDGDDKNNMWSLTDPQIQEVMRINKSGNVGIGTKYPGHRLHVSNTDAKSGGTVRFSNDQGTNLDIGVSGSNAGWPVGNDNPYIFTENKDLVILTGTGLVGIGTAAPQGGLHVSGQGTNGIALFERSGKILTLNPNYGGNNQFAHITTAAGSDMGLKLGVNEQTVLTMTTAGNVGVGTSNPGEELTVRGNLLIESKSTGAPVLELGEGLDYAEGFDVSAKDEINTGSVLIIDADNPGKLALSNKSYDTKVAGIVAGGKGLGSGVRLGAGQFDYDVALAGRVYCKVDATEEAIQAGDLLTTSTTPGYAMKAADYMRAQGAILGKAMESLEKGQKGQILVLVTLQ